MYESDFAQSALACATQIVVLEEVEDGSSGPDLAPAPTLPTTVSCSSLSYIAVHGVTDACSVKTPRCLLGHSRKLHRLHCIH
jgi:hypothetical protein